MTIPGTIDATAPTRLVASADDGDGAFVRVHDLLVHRDYVGLLEAHGLTSIDAVFSYTCGERLDKPGLERWRERMRLRLTGSDGGVTTLYVKRYVSPPWRERVRRRWACPEARSVAEVEWRWMRALARADVACPTPVALAARCDARSGRRSALLTAAVPGDALERWLARRGALNRRTVRALAMSLADLVTRFHAIGLVHRDLYLSHVFWHPHPGGPGALHLIDLQRVLRPRVRRSRWIVKDLAALNYSAPAHIVSTADRARWLKRYLNVRRLDARARTLIRRVVRKTARIAAHDRRRAAVGDARAVRAPSTSP